MADRANLMSAALLALGLCVPPLSAVRADEAAERPLATLQGDTEGVHIDILSLKRTEGNMLTLRVAFVNESGGPVKTSAFPGMNGGWKAVLVDYKAKRKYGIIGFDDGSCLCTTNLIDSAEFEPGRKVLWAKFMAPPESVQRITLLAGNGEPVEGLPITRPSDSAPPKAERDTSEGVPSRSHRSTPQPTPARMEGT